MCLFGRLLFFLTGHRYDFSSLQLDAGFILTDSFNFYMAGLTLSLNTFISEILGIVIILILANYLEQSYQMKEIIILSIILFKLSTLLFSCLSAFLLRRHLMVWAIFAPKVIFEISFWLVSSLILLFT
jgi:phosphatidylinositol glycan class O